MCSSIVKGFGTVLCFELQPQMHVQSILPICHGNDTVGYVKPSTHMRAKCVYVWMGLRTCAALPMNISLNIHHKPKTVGFLRKHKGNLVHWEAVVLCSPRVCGKLIYHTPSANCLIRMCVPAFILTRSAQNYVGVTRKPKPLFSN